MNTYQTLTMTYESGPREMLSGTPSVHLSHDAAFTTMSSLQGTERDAQPRQAVVCARDALRLLAASDGVRFS